MTGTSTAYLLLLPALGAIDDQPKPAARVRARHPLAPQRVPPQRLPPLGRPSPPDAELARQLAASAVRPPAAPLQRRQQGCLSRSEAARRVPLPARLVRVRACAHEEPDAELVPSVHSQQQRSHSGRLSLLRVDLRARLDQPHRSGGVASTRREVEGCGALAVGEGGVRSVAQRARQPRRVSGAGSVDQRVRGGLCGGLGGRLVQRDVEAERRVGSDERRLALAAVPEARRHCQPDGVAKPHVRQRRVPPGDELAAAEPHSQRAARALGRVKNRAVLVADSAGEAHADDLTLGRSRRSGRGGRREQLES